MEFPMFLRLVSRYKKACEDFNQSFDNLRHLLKNQQDNDDAPIVSD
jgi:hypothetical protein